MCCRTAYSLWADDGWLCPAGVVGLVKTGRLQIRRLSPWCAAMLLGWEQCIAFLNRNESEICFSDYSPIQKDYCRIPRHQPLQGRHAQGGQAKEAARTVRAVRLLEEEEK